MKVLIRFLLFFFPPALFALWTDLSSKGALFSYFENQPQSIELLKGFLYFSEARNTGVAFGMLQGHNEILAVIVGLMAVGIPLYGYWHRQEGKLFTVALSLVYGGALGNLYDRWSLGYVRDFIDVRFGSYHYPVFNGADSYICVGVALLMLQAWLGSRRQKG